MLSPECLLGDREGCDAFVPVGPSWTHTPPLCVVGGTGVSLCQLSHFIFIRRRRHASQATEYFYLKENLTLIQKEEKHDWGDWQCVWWCFYLYACLPHHPGDGFSPGAHRTKFSGTEDLPMRCAVSVWKEVSYLEATLLMSKGSFWKASPYLTCTSEVQCGQQPHRVKVPLCPGKWPSLAWRIILHLGTVLLCKHSHSPVFWAQTYQGIFLHGLLLIPPPFYLSYFYPASLYHSLLELDGLAGWDRLL